MKTSDTPSPDPTERTVDRRVSSLNYTLLIYSDGSAEAMWDWSSVKQRKPVEFRPTPDGGLVPVARGKARVRILREFGHVLDQVGPFQPPESNVPTDGTFDGVRSSDRRGRKPGWGEDRDATGAMLTELRADNPELSVTDAYFDVASKLNISVDTVKDHLYRKPSSEQHVRLPRIDAPETPLDRQRRDLEDEGAKLSRNMSVVHQLVLQGDDVPVEVVDYLRSEIDEYERRSIDVQAEVMHHTARWVHEVNEALTSEGFDWPIVSKVVRYYIMCDGSMAEELLEVGSRIIEDLAAAGEPCEPLTTRHSIHLCKQRAVAATKGSLDDER